MLTKVQSQTPKKVSRRDPRHFEQRLRCTNSAARKRDGGALDVDMAKNKNVHLNRAFRSPPDSWAVRPQSVAGDEFDFFRPGRHGRGVCVCKCFVRVDRHVPDGSAGGRSGTPEGRQLRASARGQKARGPPPLLSSPGGNRIQCPSSSQATAKASSPRDRKRKDKRVPAAQTSHEAERH